MRLIGTGGMGAVYLGEHPVMGRRVALKVIHRDLSSNHEIIMRFHQEARAVNQIGSEHIVEVHDFGVTDQGDHFYMMEYLEGETLAAVLAREAPLEPHRALHIAAQIADALGGAHAAGIIHRDLKPDNVMLVPRPGDQDFVKLVDFGLAKMFGGHTGVVTASGVLLGTPQYMSPEACEIRPQVDHRSDIYALGVLLFQMVTGVLPFDGATMSEILVKHITQLPPAPRGLNPGVPPAVEQILLRCLAKKPDARFQWMAELREALEHPDHYLRRAPPAQSARSVAPDEVLAAQAKARTSRPLPIATVVDAPNPLDSSPSRRRIKNDTMRLPTPPGYVSAPAPQKRVWPLVVVAMLFVLGVAAVALAWWHTTRKPAAVVSDAPARPIDTGRAVDAPARDAAPAPDAAEAPATAQLAFESTPAGAEVLGPDGAVLGKTPLKLPWPISDRAVVFTLRYPGYPPRREEVVVRQTTSLQVVLRK